MPSCVIAAATGVELPERRRAHRDARKRHARDNALPGDRPRTACDFHGLGSAI